MFQAHGVRICLHSTLRTYPGETISRYGYLPASLRSLPNTSSGHRLKSFSPKTFRLLHV